MRLKNVYDERIEEEIQRGCAYYFAETVFQKSVASLSSSEEECGGFTNTEAHGDELPLALSDAMIDQINSDRSFDIRILHRVVIPSRCCEKRFYYLCILALVVLLWCIVIQS